MASRRGRLGGKDFDFFDLRRIGKKLTGFGHQRLGDRAVEMGVAAGFIGEGVEDAEPVRPQLDCVPGRGGRLGDGQGLSRFEELLECRFLTRLGAE
jgi:hypothetical protein